jgi:hypothetical protein
VSDGLLGFEVLERLGYTHKVVLAPRGKAGTEIEPFKWLNVLAGEFENRFVRNSSRVQICEVRPAIPRRGPIPLQPAG